MIILPWSCRNWTKQHGIFHSLSLNHLHCIQTGNFSYQCWICLVHYQCMSTSLLCWKYNRWVRSLGGGCYNGEWIVSISCDQAMQLPRYAMFSEMHMYQNGMQREDIDPPAHWFDNSIWDVMQYLASHAESCLTTCAWHYTHWDAKFNCNELQYLVC